MVTAIVWIVGLLAIVVIGIRWYFRQKLQHMKEMMNLRKDDE